MEEKREFIKTYLMEFYKQNDLILNNNDEEINSILNDIPFFEAVNL